jgi:glycyl-tRNA synthetase beta chain
MSNHAANPDMPTEIKSFDSVRDVMARAEAVSQARGSSDFQAVCRAYKRAKNLYAKAGSYAFNPAPVFATSEEQRIYESLRVIGAGYLADCAHGRYDEALAKLAAQGPMIDEYFESVMVNVEDVELRANRLGFVRFLLVTFTQIADFSLIVSSTEAV